MSEGTELFDVVAVNIGTGAERFIDQAIGKKDADAVVRIAVMRRGIEEEFFKAVPHPHTLRAMKEPEKIS